LSTTEVFYFGVGLVVTHVSTFLGSIVVHETVAQVSGLLLLRLQNPAAGTYQVILNSANSYRYFVFFHELGFEN